MIKRAFYVGLVAVSAWQLAGAAKRHRNARARTEQKQALNTWENEGGNPAPARRPIEQRA